jgi:hypothetical protein
LVALGEGLHPGAPDEGSLGFVSGGRVDEDEDALRPAAALARVPKKKKSYD